MNIQKYIDRYNQPGNILVVSSYPEKGVKYSGKVCAVGGFAKNTLVELSRGYKSRSEYKKIIVLTIQTSNKEEIYEENNILVIRCIKRNSLKSYFNVLRILGKFDYIKTVLVEFEFASFGGIKMTLGLMGLIGAMRVMGKRTTLVLHQVLLDLGQLSGHLGISKKSLRLKIYGFGLKFFYKFVCDWSETVVVLEAEFKKRLSNFINPEKIKVIPHGVDSGLKTISKIKARQILKINKNEKVVLYFGYLTWYKGVDWLLDKFNEFKKFKSLKLVIAGGPSFTQKEKKHYHDFLQYVYCLAVRNDTLITGFLPENKIKLYFAASDLILLPYRTFMSSSGPLSMALGFGKPFLVSKPLSKILDTQDFTNALKELNLTKKDLIFELTGKSLGEKLGKLGELGKLGRLAKLMAEKRSFEKLAMQYAQILEEKAVLGNYFNPGNIRHLITLRKH